MSYPPNELDAILLQQLLDKLRANPLTTTQLARRAGISQPSVCRILHAQRSASTTQWCKLLDAAT